LNALLSTDASEMLFLKVKEDDFNLTESTTTTFEISRVEYGKLSDVSASTTVAIFRAGTGWVL
jgi:hypothetical protein